MLFDSLKFSNYEILTQHRVPDIFRFSCISIDLIIFTGLLNGTLRESAKRARLELTQSGRLERIHRDSIARSPREISPTAAAASSSSSSQLRLPFFFCSREIVSEKSARVAHNQLYTTRVAFFSLLPARISPHSCRGTRGGTVLFYAIVNEKFLSARTVSRICIALRFHKTHNFFHFLDSSAKERRIRR